MRSVLFCFFFLILGDKTGTTEAGCAMKTAESVFHTEIICLSATCTSPERRVDPLLSAKRLSEDLAEAG